MPDKQKHYAHCGLIAAKLFLLLCAILFLPGKSFSRNDTLFFRHFSTAQGLSNNDVTSIIQDSLGFMWYGTQSGLNKFDGYGFVTYKHNPKNKNSLVSDDISCLSVEKSGIIWIGTKTKGVNRLDPYTGIFTLYQHKPGDQNSLNENAISFIRADSTSGLIWIGTVSKGLNLLDSKNGTMRSFRNEKNNSHSLSSDSITCITRSKDGRVWIGTNGGGVNAFDMKTGGFTVYRHDKKNPNTISSDIVRDVYVDTTNNNVWIATADGLSLLNRVTGDIKIFRHSDEPYTLVSNDLTSVYKDKYGKIWVGTRRDGLNVYYPDGKFYLYSNETGTENALSSNKINTISQGRSGMFWAATQDGGLNAFNPKSLMFKFLNPPVNGSPVNDAISSVNELTDGTLLFGTKGSGIFSYDILKEKFAALNATLKGKTVIYVLDNDKNGLIIVAEDGLYFFNHGKFSGTKPLEFVTCAFSGKNNLLWLGTREKGIFSFDLKNQSNNFKAYPGCEITLPVSQILEDSHKQLWIGTLGDGVNVLDLQTGKCTTYKNNANDVHSIGSNNINGICEDLHGTVWVSTVSGGLNAFRREKNNFDCYTEQDGLPANSIGGILCDGNNNLWIGTDRGISRLTLDSANTIECRTFDKADGLATIEFLEGVSMKRKNEEMIFTCSKGLVSFYPDSIKKNPVKPPVIITEFRLANKPVVQGDETNILSASISVTEEIHLSYTQNAFTFAFTAMSFINAHKNQYKYKLEGFDKDWISTDANNRIAPYTNLQPGTYTFKVKASNNDGVWSAKETTVLIIISPPFYKMWWFITICVALIILIAYGIHRYRLSQILKVQEVRNKIASDLHDDIGSGLSSISVFSEIVRQRTGNRQEDIEPFLEKIDVTSRSMSDAIHDIVWTINPDNDKFETVLQRMKNFASELLTAKKIKLNFDFRKEIISHKLTIEQRKNFYLIFKEAINNASKYAEAKSVNVSIVVDKNQLKMRIADDGKGFDTNTPGDGNGLNNMRKRAEEIRGKLIIDSLAGKGTTIELDFKTT